ncbi:MAG: hypothetical protein ACTSR3_22905 [Candidatus Helarchaeota archaeon]
MNKRFKIIYVAGTGRNGSTLLDIVLGNSAKIQSTGELYEAITVWSTNKRCSCGKKISNCKFWSEVHSLIEKEFKVSDFITILEIQNHFEKNILAPLYLFFNKIICSNKIKLYKKFLKLLYTSIFTVSKKAILVDSSKNLLHGYILSDIFRDDFYLIHLIRDGRGQLWSWMRMGKIPILDISLRKSNSKKDSKEQYHWWSGFLYALIWVSYNLLSFFAMLKAKFKKSIQINYENFCKNPIKYIKKISRLINEDLSDLIDIIKKNNAFMPSHLIAGNRIRMLNQIIISTPDEEWKVKLPEKYKQNFWVIAGWLSVIYGYRYKN